MTVIVLVAAVLLMGPLSLAAWNEPEEFRGLKLGQNLRDQVRECPKRVWDTTERCWEQIGQPDVYGSTIYELHYFGPIGGLGGTLAARQWHDRLIWIGVTMSHDGYSRLRDIVLQRYGRPTSEYTEEVVTKGGVRWPNQTSRWQGSRVSIELLERSSRADRTLLSAYTAESDEYDQRTRSEERKKGGRDL